APPDGAGPVPAAAGPVPAAAGWHVRPAAPAVRNQELRAVAALDARTAWAVGNEDTGPGSVPLVERFDGRAWRRVTVPAATGGLDAVLPLGPADVWAVGSRADDPDDPPGPADPADGDDPGGPGRGLALHFDGRAWREVPLPAEPAGRAAHPFALAADAAGLWAVGASAADRTAQPRPLALRWDGTAWRRAPLPGPGGDAVLLAAAPDRAGGLWAGGVAYDPDGTGRPLTLHRDGAGWHQVDAPSPAGRTSTLEAVAAFAPDDVWAAGGTGPSDDPARPFLLHWDGTRWQDAALPAGTGGVLHALAAADDGTLWAAGEQPADATPGFTLRRRAGVWSHRSADRTPAGDGASLLAVAAVPGTGAAWAVGSTLPQQQDSWHPVIEAYRP
ncbi:hypothetical protein ACFQMG_34850, partial [Kitasatospora paranensis]